MTPKPWYQSVTLWGAIVAFVGLLIQTYAGETVANVWASPATQHLIGTLLSLLGISASAYGRVRAGGGAPIGKPAGPPSPPSVVVALLMMLTAGCGSTYTLRSGGYRLEPQLGGGHCLTVFGDGDPEVLRACIRKDGLSVAPALAERICRDLGTLGEED